MAWVIIYLYMLGIFFTYLLIMRWWRSQWVGRYLFFIIFWPIFYIGGMFFWLMGEVKRSEKQQKIGD